MVVATEGDGKSKTPPSHRTATMADDEGQDRGRRFDEIAMTVRNREAGRCRKCGAPEEDVRLSVHHLVPDARVPDGIDAHLPVNLVALCRGCHSELEAKPLAYQLRKLGLESQVDLMLSENEREKLNNRLEKHRPRGSDGREGDKGGVGGVHRARLWHQGCADGLVRLSAVRDRRWSAAPARLLEAVSHPRSSGSWLARTSAFCRSVSVL